MQINRISRLSQNENHQPIFDLKTAAASKVLAAFQEKKVQGRTRNELEKILRENIDWIPGSSYKNPYFKKNKIDQWVAGWGAQECAPDPSWYNDVKDNCRTESVPGGRDNDRSKTTCEEYKSIDLQTWMDKLFAARGK